MARGAPSGAVRSLLGEAPHRGAPGRRGRPRPPTGGAGRGVAQVGELRQAPRRGNDGQADAPVHLQWHLRRRGRADASARGLLLLLLLLLAPPVPGPARGTTLWRGPRCGSPALVRGRSMTNGCCAAVTRHSRPGRRGGHGAPRPRAFLPAHHGGPARRGTPGHHKDGAHLPTVRACAPQTLAHGMGTPADRHFAHRHQPPAPPSRPPRRGRSPLGRLPPHPPRGAATARRGRGRCCDAGDWPAAAAAAEPVRGRSCASPSPPPMSGRPRARGHGVCRWRRR